MHAQGQAAVAGKLLARLPPHGACLPSSQLAAAQCGSRLYGHHGALNPEHALGGHITHALCHRHPPSAAQKRTHAAELREFENNLRSVQNKFEEHCRSMNVRRRGTVGAGKAGRAAHLQAAPTGCGAASADVRTATASLQCLNLTNLAPSQRSQFSLDCAKDMGRSDACDDDSPFDPKKPK